MRSIVIIGLIDIPTFFSAFIAGVLSFLSPCVLPLIPGYISFISGKSVKELTDQKNVSKEAIIGAIFFGLAFSSVFIMLGMSATYVGSVLNEYKVVLSRVAGVIIVIFGLNMLGVLKISFLFKQAKINYKKNSAVPYYIQAFILGLAFVLGWTPCIGPILSAILILAAKGDSVYYGAKLLAVYSLGLWIPFLVTAIALGRIMKFTKKISKHIVWIERVSAGLLIIIGVLLITNNMTMIVAFLMQFMPIY